MSLSQAFKTRRGSVVGGLNLDSRRLRIIQTSGYFSFGSTRPGSLFLVRSQPQLNVMQLQAIQVSTVPTGPRDPALGKTLTIPSVAKSSFQSLRWVSHSSQNYCIEGILSAAADLHFPRHDISSGLHRILKQLSDDERMNVVRDASILGHGAEPLLSHPTTFRYTWPGTCIKAYPLQRVWV